MKDSSTSNPNNIKQVPLVFTDLESASKMVASEIGLLIKTRRASNRTAVLGMTTGSTPTALYAELVRMHRYEALSFENVVTFNVDEYYPIFPADPHCYRSYMQAHLFSHVDIHDANTHLPDGTVAISAVEACCLDYEHKIKAAGGIDIQILGIGRTGHIGFNEPGSKRDSRTRMMTMDPITRRDLSKDFGNEESVPRHAITMGVGTILEARRILLMAWGSGKSEIVRKALGGAVTSQIPASFLQGHPKTQFVLDRAAAGALTAKKAP